MVFNNKGRQAFVRGLLGIKSPARTFEESVETFEEASSAGILHIPEQLMTEEELENFRYELSKSSAPVPIVSVDREQKSRTEIRKELLVELAEEMRESVDPYKDDAETLMLNNYLIGTSTWLDEKASAEQDETDD